MADQGGYVPPNPFSDPAVSSVGTAPAAPSQQPAPVVEYPPQAAQGGYSEQPPWLAASQPVQQGPPPSAYAQPPQAQTHPPQSAPFFSPEPYATQIQPPAAPAAGAALGEPVPLKNNLPKQRLQIWTDGTTSGEHITRQ